MIKKQTDQPLLSNFKMPFQAKLNDGNRWVKLSAIIPWAEICRPYEELFTSHTGRPAVPARVAIGAMIIKHKLKLSDEETVELIRENPYLQYFIGFSSYQHEAPFVPSVFVEIRRRMNAQIFADLEQAIVDVVGGRNPGRIRKLRVDATVAPQEITYPTDQKLLNKAREQCEAIIDELHLLTGAVQKPRTYRREARKEWLAYSKKRRCTGKDHRRATRAQLQYVRRDIGYIDRQLDVIYARGQVAPYQVLRQLWIIRLLFAQQDEMYRGKLRKTPDRLVSLNQPYVRPVVRGKAGARVEFGAKLGVSVSEDGLAFVDHLSWDAYNEAGDLPDQVRLYSRRYGAEPEVVLGDQIYGNRANRQWLKEEEIRFGGQPLGRPLADEKNRKERKKQARQDAIDRIPIEGKFGCAKRGYGLGLIRTRRSDTSEAWIRMVFFVLNLGVLSRSALFTLLRRLITGKYAAYCRLKIPLTFIAREIAAKYGLFAKNSLLGYAG